MAHTPVPQLRHVVHVHDCRAVHAEALPEAASRHQRQCLQRLCLLGHCHLLLRAGRGEALARGTHPARTPYPVPEVPSLGLPGEPQPRCSGGRVGLGSGSPRRLLSPACGGPRQVFGKGNTAFWVVFSVIHIIATLLLSTQLYYMGRWKLGEGPPGAGCGGQGSRAPRRRGRWPWGPALTTDFGFCPLAGGPGRITVGAVG